MQKLIPWIPISILMLAVTGTLLLPASDPPLHKVAEVVQQTPFALVAATPIPTTAPPDKVAYALTKSGTGITAQVKAGGATPVVGSPPVVSLNGKGKAPVPPQDEDIRSQTQMLHAATGDIILHSPAVQPYLRYLDLGNIVQAEREFAFRVTSGHLQHLSTISLITAPQIVPRTGVALLRINILDYGWSAALWEKLVDADIYYHTSIVIETVVDYPGGLANDGKYYEKGKYTSKKLQRAQAPWLISTEQDKVAATILNNASQTSIPIVRGDWFFNQTAIQADRNPGYYDFLNVKNRADFQALVGFDPKKKRKKVELREAISISTVTLQPRGLARFDADEGGSYWFSNDFRLARDKVDAKGKITFQNPLKQFGDIVDNNADAHEEYGLLPNFFWATGVFNGQGVRQDAAPDFIATDGFSRSNDRRVHVNMSCTRCHTDGGMQDIDGWVRNLIQFPLALQTPDYKQYLLARQQYARNLQPYIEDDRRRFSTAVLEATGWDSKTYAKNYGEFWSRYEDAALTPEKLSRDTGTPVWQIMEALQAQVSFGQADTVASILVLKGTPRFRPLPIRQAEDIFPFVMQAIRSVKKVP